jgi:hypothetical protein
LDSSVIIALFSFGELSIMQNMKQQVNIKQNVFQEKIDLIFSRYVLVNQVFVRTETPKPKEEEKKQIQRTIQSQLTEFKLNPEIFSIESPRIKKLIHVKQDHVEPVPKKQERID